MKLSIKKFHQRGVPFAGRVHKICSVKIFTQVLELLKNSAFTQKKFKFMSRSWKFCWEGNFSTFFVWEAKKSCWSTKKENWIYHSNTNIAYDSVRNYIFAKATVNIKCHAWRRHKCWKKLEQDVPQLLRLELCFATLNLFTRLFVVHVRTAKLLFILRGIKAFSLSNYRTMNTFTSVSTFNQVWKVKFWKVNKLWQMWLTYSAQSRMHFPSSLISSVASFFRSSWFKLRLGGIPAVPQQFLANPPHDFDIAYGDVGCLAVHRNQVSILTLRSSLIIHCTSYFKNIL